MIANLKAKRQDDACSSVIRVADGVAGTKTEGFLPFSKGLVVFIYMDVRPGLLEQMMGDDV